MKYHFVLINSYLIFEDPYSIGDKNLHLKEKWSYIYQLKSDYSTFIGFNC